MKLTVKPIVAACLLAISGVASAATIESENNDVFGSADLISGAGTVDGTIGDGTLNVASNDVDLYRFALNAGDAFSALINSTTTTMVNANTELDLILVLFNSVFQSVAANDFINTVNASLSYNPAVTGTYYMSVTSRDNMPLEQVTGDSMAAALENWPFGSWSGGANAGGQYQLQVTGPVVPVPAAIWLMGSGLAGLVAVARRRKV
jgi:hypothetical protein